MKKNDLLIEEGPIKVSKNDVITEIKKSPRFRTLDAYLKLINRVNDELTENDEIYMSDIDSVDDEAVLEGKTATVLFVINNGEFIISITLVTANSIEFDITNNSETLEDLDGGLITFYFYRKQHGAWFTNLYSDNDVSKSLLNKILEYAKDVSLIDLVKPEDEEVEK